MESWGTTTWSHAGPRRQQ
uniref:Uncharacterized protein n=1 Tax=Arundo donax TaxID=35708 RepID=A0A0A9CGX5_ARUDO